MYKTRAIRFIQNGRVFYSVVRPPKRPVELSKVDVWDSESRPRDTNECRATRGSVKLGATHWKRMP